MKTRVIGHKTKIRNGIAPTELRGWNPESIVVKILEQDVPDLIATEREQHWIDKLNACNLRKADGSHTDRSRLVYDWHAKKPKHVIDAIQAGRRKLELDPKWVEFNLWKDRKLTVSQVRDVRDNPDGLTGRRLADKHGISASLVCLIRKRRRYAEVD